MNRLAHERSPYLRHAARQPIDWYPWCDAAFEKAKQEDKAVFLSTGAVWCHWCHVMAQESFEDPETASLLNERFISIKLDRDELPHIDQRYQQAVAAMGGGSGWPLSVFLTPDREPFYGGTYFPPQDRQGRPGFGNVLRSVSDFYRSKRADVAEYAQRVREALRPEALQPAVLDRSMLDEAENAMLAVFDQEHGGFGSAPKFPMPGALEFLIRRAAGNPDSAAGRAARSMLDAMARGGFHDQLGGGFHRYSTDAAWMVPHFEKMADDNAGLLRNYVDGYAVFGDERFRDAAQGIITFTRTVLSDPSGGFFASQDADVTPDDEGGYFTWTGEEFRKALDPDEYALLSLHLLHDRGSMHHDPAKKVLSLVSTPREIGARLGRSADEVSRIIRQGKGKLFAARSLRTLPFVDRTLYTSLNGMMISAYFHAYGVLGDEEVKRFGVMSLERVLAERFVDGQLFHTEGIPAALEDHARLIDALVAGYEATAEQRYIATAETLTAVCLDAFFDKEAGGFFDTEKDVLGIRLKRIEDVPHPSANAAIALLLLKLSLITGRDSYRRAAEQTLAIFAGPARELGVHAGSYFSVLDAFFRMIRLTVEADPAGALARAARSIAGLTHTTLHYHGDSGMVQPCVGTTCHEPARSPEALRSVC
ncbi:MAG TPA: thioredoxin domain-containing protein, partial [Nitrospirota bacterium]